jgi:beta-1,4-N-acetylglucosaminyltransferase
MTEPTPTARSGGVLLVASSGGHLLELLQLRDVWPRSERQWVTFEGADTRSLLEGELVTYAFSPTNRNIPNLLRNLGLAWRVLVSARPRAVVTTGAGVAVPFAWMGRLRGARVVYVESLTRIHRPSLTARLVHPVAHDFFVQWPELRQAFRKADYEGTVFDLS